MEIAELMDEINDLRPADEEPSHTLNLLQIKLGQVAEGLMRIDDIEQAIEDGESEISERKVQGVKRDMFAGMLAACMEFAAEHEIDVERAVEDRLVQMQEMKRQAELSKKLQDGGFSGDPVDTDLDPEDDRSFL